MLCWLLGTVFTICGMVFIFKHEISFGLSLLAIGELYLIAYKVDDVRMRLRDVNETFKRLTNNDKEMEDF